MSSRCQHVAQYVAESVILLEYRRLGAICILVWTRTLGATVVEESPKTVVFAEEQNEKI